MFRSPCDLDAIAAVAGEDGVEVLDIASQLVGTSLVWVAEGSDGEPRIALLETIRAFALERLEESAEAEQVRRRHLQGCIDVADKMIALLRGPLHTVALDGIGAIEDDIRAALGWSLQPAGADGRERVEAGHKRLALAYRYWYRFGNGHRGSAVAGAGRRGGR